MSQEPDALAAAGPVNGEVMGAVEGDSDPVYVIADISRDDAYLTVPMEETATLSAWR